MGQRALMAGHGAPAVPHGTGDQGTHCISELGAPVLTAAPEQSHARRGAAHQLGRAPQAGQAVVRDAVRIWDVQRRQARAQARRAHDRIRHAHLRGSQARVGLGCPSPCRRRCKQVRLWGAFQTGAPGLGWRRGCLARAAAT